METREQKIAHAFKAFAEHKAELKVSGNIQTLDWRQPKSGAAYFGSRRCRLASKKAS